MLIANESPDEFLNRVVKNIPGFLEDFTAVCAMHLLDYQDELQVKGSLLEIGVYGGKFLSVLARSAAKNHQTLVGVDPYFHFSQEQVISTLAPLMNGASEKMKLWKGLSSQIMPEELIPLLKGRARFIDIDGGHDYPDVVWDLRICEGAVANGGIIAVDDFVNVHDIGIADAFFRFFHSAQRSVVPFAYVANKLFMTTPSHAQLYKDRIETMAIADTTHSNSQRFRARLATVGAGRRMVETDLLGQKVLIIQ